MPTKYKYGSQTCYLRNTSGEKVNIPEDIWKEAGFKINDLIFIETHQCECPDEGWDRQEINIIKVSDMTDEEKKEHGIFVGKTLKQVMKPGDRYRVDIVEK